MRVFRVTIPVGLFGSSDSCPAKNHLPQPQSFQIINRSKIIEVTENHKPAGQKW
jgi:hypothetical protein